MINLPSGFDVTAFTADICSMVAYIMPVFMLVVAGNLVLRLIKRA